MSPFSKNLVYNPPADSHGGASSHAGIALSQFGNLRFNASLCVFAHLCDFALKGEHAVPPGRSANSIFSPCSIHSQFLAVKLLATRNEELFTRAPGLALWW
jgi:hypothetical protein